MSLLIVIIYCMFDFVKDFLENLFFINIIVGGLKLVSDELYKKKIRFKCYIYVRMCFIKWCL